MRSSRCGLEDSDAFAILERKTFHGLYRRIKILPAHHGLFHSVITLHPLSAQAPAPSLAGAVRLVMLSAAADLRPIPIRTNIQLRKGQFIYLLGKCLMVLLLVV